MKSRRHKPIYKRTVRAVRGGKVLVNGLWRKIEQSEASRAESQETRASSADPLALDSCPSSLVESNGKELPVAKSVYDLAGAQKIDALREEFNRRMSDAVADCKSRPGVKQPRVVTLIVKVTPHPQEPDDVLVDHEVKAKTPTKHIDRYRMQATANNGLKFQPNSPEEPDQEGFDFGE